MGILALSALRPHGSLSSATKSTGVFSRKKAQKSQNDFLSLLCLFVADLSGFLWLM
jgi:hypothetical protein